mmetsp:Transcript_87146/g.249687  ORF Transcript_87146/g.249687 Transcript_87146/m.249687 type:complete len:130 (-) Transcript_87146:70-459(-)|eukprot:CAMPEP_0177500164 /NCGR_PEP_ID=MMETSP0369-20130122/36519_1 /TAXON_ID=447022 ORGANISM="Scrippsiella hangoei-like, Strain SHHI-4" /NCGR_SAMPLE_ID=MMETSP0369 /ASSEMBLY_ACC=CAM_ASM_000364 /LENGTH=129 /DNA_ID=CAMNT_0018977533 /DNA_START=43 /DNA_END=432 /DNA_ORIENTATION=+
MISTAMRPLSGLSDIASRLARLIVAAALVLGAARPCLASGGAASDLAGAGTSSLDGSDAGPGSASEYLASGLREDLASLLAGAVGLLICSTHVRAPDEALVAVPEDDPDWRAEASADSLPKLYLPFLWL